MLTTDSAWDHRVSGDGASRPNVLLVVTDQQRGDLFGAAGRLPIETPAYDRLCREGARFDRAYVGTPICVPSRVTLLSGQYPSRHGVWVNGILTPEDVLSLPRLLSERGGYQTGIIGKSHFQPGRAGTADPVTYEVVPDGADVGIEAAPRSRDWDFFRGWSGPWYGFDHAKINVGHTYRPYAYSMHYGLSLHEAGIPMSPPYFMSFEEAEREFGHHGAAGLPSKNEPKATPATWAMPEENHSSTWVADETIAYLREYAAGLRQSPFYLAVNFPDPHPPFAVPEPWDTMYDGVELPPPARELGEWEGKPEFYRANIEERVLEGGWHERFPPARQHAVLTPTNERTELEERWWRTYMGMQSLVDKNLGRILDELDALGLADDVLVIATSDHGDSMGDHFLWHKGGCHYDGTIRVPLIVRWPGRVPASAASSSLQSLVDIPTTIMSAAGLEPDPRMQGVDQLAAWSDPGVVTREGVFVENRSAEGLQINSWVTDRYRVTTHNDLAHGRTEVELYDLIEDPEELHSLADDPGKHALVDSLVAESWRYSVSLQTSWLERVRGS
jgi:arylsulfatase A-like enzyme